MGRLRQAPFDGPARVLAYLGRYIRRIAISDDRLFDIKDGRVSLPIATAARNSLSASAPADPWRWSTPPARLQLLRCPATPRDNRLSAPHSDSARAIPLAGRRTSVGPFASPPGFAHGLAPTLTRSPPDPPRNPSGGCYGLHSPRNARPQPFRTHNSVQATPKVKT